MAKGIGGKIFLDGEKEFKNSVKNINNEIRAMTAELRSTSSEFTKQSKTVADAKRENEAIQKVLDGLKNRLEEQKKGLENATAEYGEADKRTLKWRETIAKTEAEINRYNHRIDANEEAIENASKSTGKLGDETRLYGQEAEDAGKSTLKLGDLIKANLISEAIIGGVKALGSAMKTIASGVFDLGKQSVDSFAEYEQLVGGVETLFEDSASAVIGYAHGAYRTAGVTANQYMEQVTSFSASLLQGLNGDTQKSAEYAHMALIDMADNANKMGSDMSSIQNAYQGFAKQNYTMLDNLKLGYGGTKGEMERLLKDAKAISGIDYSLDNLHDVFQAIHVIQGELGITGTTVLEAEETISGSINMMKASWENFVMSLADSESDMDYYVEDLIANFLTVADNIIPVVEMIVANVVAVFPEFIAGAMEYIPQFLEMGIELLTSLAEGVMNALPDLMETIVDILMMVSEKLIDFLPDIVKIGINFLMSLIDGLVDTIPDLIPVALDAVETIVDTLLDNIDMLIDGGIRLTIALAEGLIDAIPRLVEKAPVIITKLVSAFIENLPKLLTLGKDLLVSITTGITEAVPQLLGKIPQIGRDIIKKFKEINWIQLGRDILGGIGSGITGAIGGLVSSAKKAASNLLSGVKGFFGIRSPSTVFRDQVGAMLAEGLGEGFEDEMKDVSSSMHDAVPTDFDSNLSVSSNLRTISQPTRVEQLLTQLLNKDTTLVLDTGQLVGATKEKYDKALGDLLELRLRGA